MSQTPPGWYADPQTAPGYAPGTRWWDGERWTEYVHPAQQPVQHGQQGQYGQPADRRTTPDGEPLAGWGIRFGAYVIDMFILFVATALVGYPFLSVIVGEYVDLIRETMDAAEVGAPPPSQYEIYGEIWLPLVGFALVGLLVNFVYHVSFLRWRAATPGKLMLGLRVRLRGQPGPLAWATILRRWLAQFGPNLLGLIPFVGIAASLYGLLDGLWPLWDERRQAVHDKFARTNVVRARPSA